MIKNQNRSKREYCVYIHTSPSGKNYVGITSQKTSKRWRNGNGYKHSPIFNSAIKKYGWENFYHKIVAVGLSKCDAEIKEVKLISELKSNNRKYGYNVENGGNTNGKHSALTKQKISSALKGHFVSMEARKKISLSRVGKKRKPFSNEHIEKMRQAHLGKKMSKETRERLSIAHQGKVLSSKTKQLISKNRRGIPNISLRKVIIQIDKTGASVDCFCSLTFAEEKTKICKSNISNVLKGKRKSAGGFYWKYAKGGDSYY